MLYAHKCADSEEELLTNLATMDVEALPFPSKSATAFGDDDIDEWRGYDVANTRIDMLLRGWGHPLD